MEVSQKYTDNLVCLDIENFYISGEPATNSEASVVVSWEWNPELIRSDEHPDFDETKLYEFKEVNVRMHVTFNQV